MAHDPQQHSSHAPEHHAASLKMYFGVFAALMVFTILTVAVSPRSGGISLGAMSTSVALAIAVTKATLVVLFFMHVWHSTRLTWVIVIGSILMLGVLFVVTFSDYLSRGLAVY